MIRQFSTAVAVRVAMPLVIAFLMLSTLFVSPLSAMAADYGQSQTASQNASQSASQQESQSYPSQSTYDNAQNASDYSYTDKQSNQNKPQENQQGKQSNQTSANKDQYAQQEQSYQEK
ncbi:MAG: hypothetical protein AAF716_14660 [Cyanobacteria bacterium P01_D01_bin.1]